MWVDPASFSAMGYINDTAYLTGNTILEAERLNKPRQDNEQFLQGRYPSSPFIVWIRKGRYALSNRKFAQFHDLEVLELRCIATENHSVQIYKDKAVILHFE